MFPDLQSCQTGGCCIRQIVLAECKGHADHAKHGSGVKQVFRIAPMGNDQEHMHEEGEAGPQNQQHQAFAVGLKNLGLHICHQSDVFQSFEDHEPGQPGQDDSRDPRPMQEKRRRIFGLVSDRPTEDSHDEE